MKINWLMECLKLAETKGNSPVSPEKVFEIGIEERVVMILEQKLIPLIEKVVDDYLAKKGLHK
jgi:hypothetical protein